MESEFSRVPHIPKCLSATAPPKSCQAPFAPYLFTFNSFRLRVNYPQPAILNIGKKKAQPQAALFPFVEVGVAASPNLPIT